jgi:nucleoside phosphorylase
MIQLIDRVATMSNNAEILLVTATEVESRAVLKMAEESRGDPSSSLEVGNGTYRDLGRVNGKTVWLAQSEKGSGGPGGAHETIGQAIREVNPDEVIMVGIAFGTNRATQEIGDVLVSQQLHLYEPQRRGKSRVISRGDKASASPRLLQRFRNARLDWQMANVHFGLILSGEKLIDDDEFVRGLLIQEPEAIGGEMEGAGLYVPCQTAKKDWILVKAICDWADGKKSEAKIRRQLKAAHNAAHFVWHALTHAPKKPDHQSSPDLTPCHPNSAGDHLGGEHRRPTVGLISDKTTPASAPQRVTIRERSAAEIIVNLEGVTSSYEFRGKVEDLYLGRWTQEPGWHATVNSLPSKLPGGRWFCAFNEVGSKILVMVYTAQDVSMLRPKDSVTVSGRISRVSICKDVCLEDAIVRGDNVQFP